MRDKKVLLVGIVVFFAVAVFLTGYGLDKKQLQDNRESQGNNFGEFCFTGVFGESTGGSRESEEPEAQKKSEDSRQNKKTESGQKSAKKEEHTSKEYISSKPLVLIYHTHTTESYRPSTGSNFHKVEKENTVRQVGDSLKKSLEAEGIKTIHNEKIHDRPSYNMSYSKSLETVAEILRENPSIRYVIDLHRDALASGKGKTVKIKGKKTATYALVVGQGNSNYRKLRTYAERVNAAAEKYSPGFGGGIIEKCYSFNQYVCDRHILLEVGNNQNYAGEAVRCGKHMGRVLAGIIREDMGIKK